MDFQFAQSICNIPIRLHPVSELFLDYYNTGKISTAVFLRYFSLPNSDYIEIAACYVNILLTATSIH